MEGSIRFIHSSPSLGCENMEVLRDSRVDGSSISRMTKRTVSESFTSGGTYSDDDTEIKLEGFPGARLYHDKGRYKRSHQGLGERNVDTISCSSSTSESTSTNDEDDSSERGRRNGSSSRTSSDSYEDGDDDSDDESTSSGDEETDDETTTDSEDESRKGDDDEDDETESEEEKDVTATSPKVKGLHKRKIVAKQRSLGGGSAHSINKTIDDGIPLMVQINTTEDSICSESQTTISSQFGSMDLKSSSKRSSTNKNTLRRYNTAPSNGSRSDQRSSIEPVDECQAHSQSGAEVSIASGGSHVSRREAFARGNSDEHLFRSGSGRRGDADGSLPTPGGSLSSSISASRSALQSAADLSTTAFKKYTTASGLPPQCQLRDAQFLKLNFPESHWAPDIKELEHLESLMNVQCTLICSYDPSIRESFWVCLMKVMKKRRATGVSQICIGYVKQNLKCCDLPRGSQIVLLPKHIQKVDSKSSDVLFQKLMASEQKQKEMTRIRPVLPGGGPHLPGGP